MRSTILALFKRLLWWGMRRPVGAKLANLVSEERLAFLHYRAMQRSGAALAKELGNTVRDGPFRGLRYPTLSASGSAVLPKILGSYEEELHPLIEAAIARRYRRIINIGAAEGYYATGLAQRMPDTVIEAFEMDASARLMLKRMAEVNDVADRVRLHGICTTADLNRLELSNDLLLVDCEGAELDLLDPVRVPALASCDILVELHSVRGTNTGDTLRARLAETHSGRVIPDRPRVPENYPVLMSLPAEDRSVILHERTTLFGWMWFTSARSGPSES